MDSITIPTSPTLSHKYGTFSSDQTEETLNGLRKKIFFLLLLADPENKAEFEQKNYDVQETFNNILLLMDGINSLLNYPSCFVTAYGMLEEARLIYLSENGFDSRRQISFKQYKSLVLGAGNEILKIKGGDPDA